LTFASLLTPFGVDEARVLTGLLATA